MADEKTEKAAEAVQAETATEEQEFNLNDPELAEAFGKAMKLPERPIRGQSLAQFEAELEPEAPEKKEQPETKAETKVEEKAEIAPTEPEKEEAPSADAMKAELDKWKKMFGDSQNAVGEMRRELDALKQGQQQAAQAESAQQLEDPNFWGEQLYGKDTWDTLMSEETPKETRDFYKTEVMAKKRMMELVAQSVDNRDKRTAQAFEDMKYERQLADVGLGGTKGEQIMEAIKQKYPWVAQLPKFDQVAAMSDLAQQELASAGASQARQPNGSQQPVAVNADHIVEANQASTPIVEDSEALLMQKFDEMKSEKDQLGILGDMFVQNRMFQD